MYLERGLECTVKDIQTALRRQTIDRVLVPALFGSARRNKGVQDVLDAVCLYLPHAGKSGYKHSGLTTNYSSANLM